MNTPEMSDAVTKAFEKINAMTPDEFKMAVQETAETGIGRMIVDSGAHSLLMRGDEKIPTRMKDVDPVVRDMMMGPHCVIS